MLWALLAVAAVLTWVALAMRQVVVLFVLVVRGARVRLTRGRLPKSLYDELVSVLERARVKDATVRVVRAGPHARVICTGVPEDAAQQLRNLVGNTPRVRIERGNLQAEG